MSTFIPPTPAATKSAEQHEEPSEQDSFNHLLYKVLRLTSEQVQDLNDWMKHRGIPNVHEIIVQNFCNPHELEDDLQFIREDKQQMIIDHNRSLPKSGSSSLSTPNKSPSPLPHKPTPQQTAKSQQAHTHQSDKSTADTTKVETTPSDPLLAMVHQSIHTSDDDASDITKVLSAKRSRQIQVCK